MKGIKFVKSIIDILLYLLLILAILIWAFTFCFTHFNNGHIRTVISPSMEPVLPVGSIIANVPKSFEDIKVGDDITFYRDDGNIVITHRVIEKNEEDFTFVTQGTANDAEDAPTHYSQVEGVVIGCIPLIGFVAEFLASPKGKISFIIFALTITIISFLLDSLLEENKKTTKKEIFS